MAPLKDVRCAAAFAAFLCIASAQSPEPPQTVLNQARRLRALGRYSEAAPLFATLIQDAEKSQATGRVLSELLDEQGLNESNNGNYAAAEIAFNHSLAVLRTAGPFADIVKTHLAEVYLAELRAPDADALLRQAIASLQGAPTLDRQALANAYNDLAVVCALLKKRPQPDTLFRQALGLLEEEYGPEHPMLLSTLNPLALLLVREHRYTEALVAAERAWNILQANAPRIPDPDRAAVLDIVAQVYAHNGRLNEAVGYARQASNLAEEVYGPASVRFGEFLRRYADILNRADRKQEARRVQKQANAILAQTNRQSTGGFTVRASALR